MICQFGRRLRAAWWALRGTRSILQNVTISGEVAMQERGYVHGVHLASDGVLDATAI